MNPKLLSNKNYKPCENFTMSVYKALEDNPIKLQSFIALFTNKKNKGNPMQSLMSLIDIIRDHTHLVDQLNKLVPEELKVPQYSNDNALGGYKNNDDNNDDDEAANNIMMQLEKRKPEIFHKLIILFQEMKQDKAHSAIYRERLNELLQDEPKILEYFMYKLDEDNKPKDKDNNDTQLEQSYNTQNANQDKTITRIPKIRQKSVKIIETETPIASPPVVVPTTTTITTTTTTTTTNIQAPTMKNEYAFFNYLKTGLIPDKYNDLIKLISLYTECILSAHELFLMTKELLAENENYLAYFQELILSREPSRRKLTDFYKPLNEIDFKKQQSERLISYIKVPNDYPFFRNPKTSLNPTTNEVLNTTWVSVPHGSEHESSFIVMRKNVFEEALFKCEEERYEFDNTIQIYSKAARFLENIADPKLTQDNIETLIEKILKLRVLQKIYANNAEILSLFKKNPRGASPVLLERVQQKIKELKETKLNIAKKNWHEISDKNFHRSLDHRSFIFKQHEKKYTNTKNFLTDAQNRFKQLTLSKPEMDITQFWKVLNTFDEISNGISLERSKSKQIDDQFSQQLLDANFQRKNLPIYHIDISNQKINQDAYDILTFALQCSRANYSEKTKRTFKSFMNDLIKIPLKNPQNFDTVIPESQFLTIVSKIESKIYDKTFNYFGQYSNGKNESRDDNNKIIDENSQTITGMQGIITNSMAYTEGDQNEHSNDLSTNAKKIQQQQFANKARKDSDDIYDFDSIGSGFVDEKENYKEMEFIDGLNTNEVLFLPKKDADSILFYGTQNVYSVIRLYFTLYERLQKAYQISRTFELNSKTALLTEEQKEKLAIDRYETFKWILVHLLRQNFDNMKFEDFTRSIFGNDAYLVFYIDKIISMLIKSIQSLSTDELSIRALSFFGQNSFSVKGEANAKISNRIHHLENEEIYLSLFNYLIEFHYNPQTFNFYINLYETPYKNWTNNSVPIITHYIETYASRPCVFNHAGNSRNAVFLRRNKEKIRRKQNKRQKIIFYNNIEMKPIPNTTKIIADSINKEDIIISFNRFKKRSLIDDIMNEYKRVMKFKAWRKSALKI